MFEQVKMTFNLLLIGDRKGLLVLTFQNQLFLKILLEISGAMNTRLKLPPSLNNLIQIK